MIQMRRLFCGLLLGLVAGCASIERLAIPNVRMIDGFELTDGSEPGPSHQSWTTFLQRYARPDDQGVVRLAYGEVSELDRLVLDAYIGELAATDTAALSRSAQLALWVNLYNAKTVAVVLEHYPVPSIRAIRSGPLDVGPWNENRLSVNGRSLSLHDIEHGVVRPVWAGTPETHYLLNCAAVGCPNLGLQAYTAANVDASLEAAARAFINDPRGVAVQPNGRIRVSKIYAWYRRDFGGSNRAVLDHLRRYAAPDLRTQLEAVRRIAGYDYDWTLNDRAQPKL